MFTGLIEGLGSIARVRPKGPDAELLVAPPWPWSETVLGESVAISGPCLTVTEVGRQGFRVDVSAETLGRTTLGGLKPGARVNLERALKLGDRLGGHLVSGHVDCLGRVAAVRRLGESTRLRLTLPPEHLALVVEKGSISVDGVSLTVNAVEDSGLDLNLIPLTLASTTLSLVKEGDSVNIETDLIGKYVAKLLGQKEPAKGPGKGLSAEALKSMGF